MTTKPIAAPLAADATSGWRIRAYQIAWGLALCFYFLEYASRSAPAVMIEHLATAFGTSAIGAHYLVGTGPQLVVRPNAAGTDVSLSMVRAGTGPAGLKW